MWFEESVIYQIYPLGLCGAPLENDGIQEHRILKINNWIEHIKDLGATCILFNPLFESDAHGYDTRDYKTVDCRLGTNEDLKEVCEAIHKAGLKILFDGVFNHVGRGFWAFKDVLEKRWDSPYKDWFRISFDGNNSYNDGLWYECWEGCENLVKLNLQHPEVKQYLFDVVRNWVDQYDVDGLRLDVAYCLDRGFLGELRGLANTVKPDFVLLGETLHGDYNQWMNDGACHSVTNYECYKGLYSSFNSRNMHEIAYSLNRQFGSEQWCLYTGKHLLSFVDNHDVSRIATILEQKEKLAPLYGLIFGMPGIPAVYYGSEWGMEGDKKNGDPTLRPAVEAPQKNQLTGWITALAKAHAGSDALCYGSYRQILVQPGQLIFERRSGSERVIVAVNMDDTVFHADFDAQAGQGVDLITGKLHDFGGGSDLGPYSCCYWKTEC
ncbi:MAG: alpha-amylase family glycosyl hydrolase [Lachnospiraceae bacterium]|nr:alpha-amylase family glycosyl hydrolase [Lachnospiraceae bacterium]